METRLIFLIVFAVIGSANAMLVNNGGFDADAANWELTGGSGAPGTWGGTHITTGGNPGGYVTLEEDPGAGGWAWAVWYQSFTEDLDVWGIPAGTAVTMSADIIGIGASALDYVYLKMESFDGASNIGEYEEQLASVTTSWANYSINYTILSAATGFKCILVAKDAASAAEIGFDNVEIIIPGGTPALKPVPIVGAGLAAVNDVISWTNPDPNNPGDTITADVYILESDIVLTNPDLTSSGSATLVADDTTAESLDLSDAGFTIQTDKYYYWAVHITDPEPTVGEVIGFDWNFQTDDAPPTDVSAGPDQYLWLVGGVKQFTLTGTYTDDGESTVDVLWEDISDPLEQAPGTTVTINSPTSATTTVDVDGDGWYLFKFTVTDAAGSGSDEVNVGVYPDACAAAYADPDDLSATYPNGHGDIDGDCDTDLEDFALLAASWVDCMTDKITCP